MLFSDKSYGCGCAYDVNPSIQLTNDIERSDIIVVGIVEDISVKADNSKTLRIAVKKQLKGKNVRESLYFEKGLQSSCDFDPQKEGTYLFFLSYGNHEALQWPHACMGSRYIIDKKHVENLENMANDLNPDLKFMDAAKRLPSDSLKKIIKQLVTQNEILHFRDQEAYLLTELLLENGYGSLNQGPWNEFEPDFWREIRFSNSEKAFLLSILKQSNAELTTSSLASQKEDLVLKIETTLQEK